MNLSIFFARKVWVKRQKKSSRIANEGAVGVFNNSKKTVLIEINTETDFAAKNEVFIDFVEKIANYALLSTENEFNLDKFMKKEFESKKISQHFTEIIAKIGENIVLRRLKIFKQDINTQIFSYTHNTYKKNIGKICAVLKADIESQNSESLQLGKNLCMHIAALKPLALDINNLDKKLIEKEKEIQFANIKSSGKPDNIVNKILEGKMKKFYSEVTFFNQVYILENNKTIGDVIKEFSLTKNKFNVTDFSLFVLGSWWIPLREYL